MQCNSCESPSVSYNCNSTAMPTKMRPSAIIRSERNFSQLIDFPRTYRSPLVQKRMLIFHDACIELRNALRLAR